jgi:hypothetical protein
MFQVTVAQQCGCFRRSGQEPTQTFDNKDDALIHAQEVASTMNEEFCQKHKFNVAEDGNNFLILMGPGR